MRFPQVTAVFSQISGIAIATALPLATIAAAPAGAFSFSRVVAFGDSLTDTGNAFALSGGTVPPPALYPSNGRFSNGQVWVEYLAPRLGAPLTSLAFGGARTDGTNNVAGVPGLAQQIAAVPVADPQALYVIWAGANDYLNRGGRNPQIPVSNLSLAVQTLAGVGAKNIAIANLPNLGAVPGTSGNPTVAAGLNTLTGAHNALLAGTLSVLGQQLPASVNLFSLDFNRLFSDAIANPTQYGFSNVTDSCLFTGCTTPDTYLFWDEIHPTTAGHQRLADFAFASLEAQSVPEPSATLGLLVGGGFLSGIAALKRRQRQQPAIDFAATPVSKATATQEQP